MAKQRKYTQKDVQGMYDRAWLYLIIGFVVAFFSTPISYLMFILAFLATRLAVFADNNLDMLNRGRRR